MRAMLDAGILTRCRIMCSHREPVYQQEAWSCGVPRSECQYEPGRCDRLTESEQPQERSILLPLFHLLTEQEQNRVITVLKVTLQNG